MGIATLKNFTIMKTSKIKLYDLEFQDTFIITGGTGQFEGATGTLTTDSYVNMTTQQTDHVWSGTITVKK